MRTVIAIALLVCVFAAIVSASHNDTHALPNRPVDPTLDDDLDDIGNQATVDSYSPTWSVLKTGGAPNWLHVKGCGFRTFAEATCVWDFYVTSPVAYIISDTEIYCEIPQRERSEFQTLPQVGRVDIVFDGNRHEHWLFLGAFRWGPQVDCETAIVPTRGPTTGGSLTIHGEGFNDAALAETSLNVWLDDQPASGCSPSSDGTSIQCSSIPASTEIHKFSLVSVTWGGNFTHRGEAECYLHATQLYRYGPIVEDVSACTGVFGGQTVTISGVGFDDGILNVQPLSPDSRDDFETTNDFGTVSGSAFPSSSYLVELTFGNPIPESDNPNNAQAARIQVYASRSSDTQLTFPAPDVGAEVSTDDTLTSQFNDMFGNEATVKVYYRQTKRLTALGGGSFFYGASVTTALDSSGSGDNKWHTGGGESICVNGCFRDYLNAGENPSAVIKVNGNNACTAAPTISATTVCCTLTALDVCGEETTELPVTVELSSDVDATSPKVLTADNTVHIGPILGLYDSNNAEFLRTTVKAGSTEFSGTNLFYAATGSSVWDSVTVSDGDSSGVFVNTDSTITFTWNLVEFGQSSQYTVRFSEGGLNCNLNFGVNFGPTCTGISPENGPINGGSSITASGSLMSGYTIIPRLLDTNRADCILTDDFDSTCPSDERGSELLGGSSGVTFSTLADKITANRNAGRRYWGQEFEVVLQFNSAEDGLFSGTQVSFGSAGNDCIDCSSGSVCACSGGASGSRAFLHCGTYRFGPVTTSLTPCRGSIAGGTSVTFAGSATDDSWYRKQGGNNVDRTDSPHIAVFGNLVGDWTTQSSNNNGVTQTTVWGAVANVDHPAYVIFDACNMTEPLTDDDGDVIVIHWGPRFLDTGITVHNNLEASDDGDIWGAYPVDGVTQEINLHMVGLDEFCPGGDCNDAVAFIDGARAEIREVSGNDAVVTLPPRPFGTIAKVCVQFQGSNEEESHPRSDSPWLPNDAIEGHLEQDRLVCAKQHVHYDIWVGAPDTDSLPTSGGGSNAVDLIGHIDAIWGTPGIFVGGYPATGETIVGEQATWSNPSHVYEFNTDVSVRLQWFIDYGNSDVQDAFPDYCERLQHWSSWSTGTIHLGPQCLGVLSQTGGSLDSTRAVGDVEVNLAATHLKDCDESECSSLTENLNAPFCANPQRTGSFQQPWQEGDGIKFCYHRMIYVFHSFNTDTVSLPGSPGLAQSLSADPDSVDAAVGDLTDNHIRIKIPALRDCGYASFALYFPDALVSSESQRFIQCPNAKFTYGPTVTSHSAVWTDGANTAYGYGYSDPLNDYHVHHDYKYTIFGSGWNDDFFTEDDGGTPLAPPFEPEIVLNSDNNGQDIYDTGAQPNSHSRTVRFVNNYDTDDTVTVQWRSGSTTLCTFNTDFIFHYGPVITEATEVGCLPTSDAASPSDTNVNVVISGRAFECCGFASLGGLTDPSNDPTFLGQTRCRFVSGEYTAEHYNHKARSPGTLGSTLSTVTCEVPPHDRADQRLYGYGLFFGATLSGTACPTTTCSDAAANAAYPLSLTEDGEYLPAICYGPKLTVTDQHRGWSGFDEGCNQVDGTDNTITLEGVNFDSNNDNSVDVGTNEVTLTFASADSGTNDALADLTGGEVHGLVPVYRKQCGLDDDFITVTFTVNGADYKQREWIPNSPSIPSYVDETGDPVGITVSYGPVVDNVTPDNANPGGNVVTFPDGEWRVWTDPDAQAGGNNVGLDFNIQYTSEWTCSNSNDFFSDGIDYLCVFGNRRISVDDDDADGTRSPNSLTAQKCFFPAGNFGDSATVQVIIDPHFDEFTIHDVDDDDDGYWHWFPRADRISSKDWSGPSGLETVTVYGRGFSQYSSVSCSFSSTDAVQGDILTDQIVVCQTPPNAQQVPSTTTISLSFCGSDPDSPPDCPCTYGCDGGSDTVSPPESYVFPGVSDVWPTHGPIHGNTVVSFTHIGLDRYNRVDCVWHLSSGITTLPMTVESGSATCVSPASTVDLVHIEVIGYWWHWAAAESNFLGNHVAEFYFDFSEPHILSVSPVSVEPGSGSGAVPVTVTGTHFNGGLPDSSVNGTGVYTCLWQTGAEPLSDDPRDLGSGRTFPAGSTLRTNGIRVSTVDDTTFSRAYDTWNIVCQTPTNGFDRIGAYPFEIEFSNEFQTSSEHDFDVVVSGELAMTAWESDPSWIDEGRPVGDQHFVDEFPDSLLTIFGSGLFGGRHENNDHISGYLVRFDANPDFNSDLTPAITVATLSDDRSAIIVQALGRDMRNVSTSGETDGYANFPVSVSVDGGYSFSNSIDILYRRNRDLEDCLNAASALSHSLFALLSVAVAVFAFFM